MEWVLWFSEPRLSTSDLHAECNLPQLERVGHQML